MPEDTRINEIVLIIREWFSSQEGRDAIRDALKRAEEMTSKLSEDQRVDQEKLHEPVTV